jgi:Fic family protein
MEDIKKALQLKVELDLLRPIAKEQEDRILQKFRLDWNYHSNHLEGNSLTYGETKALILFGITAQGKPLKDTLEITGHNEAINWVLEMISGDRPLTENFIRELHSLLLKHSYKESKNEKGEIIPRKISSGKYKTSPNHVQTRTGEIFYFASPEETPAKMHDLLTWYNEKIVDTNANPLLIAAEFHYKFILIHPFDDGNGRTARILMNFILMKFGYPPVIIKTEDKANYFAALQMADAGNIETFINYIAQNLNRSLEIMIAGANGEDIEEPDDLNKEIALLEQKLKKFEIIYDNNEKEILKVNLLKIISLFVKKNEPFHNLYIYNTFQLYHGNLVQEQGIPDTSSSIDQFINFIIEYYLKKVAVIKIGFYYHVLQFKGFEQNDFFSFLKFEFKNKNLIIRNSSNEIISETLINSIMSGREVEKIVNSEIKQHKQFIEKKISEIEKNE